MARGASVAARVHVELEGTKPTLGFDLGKLSLALGEFVGPYIFSQEGIISVLTLLLPFSPSHLYFP
jgi:hypothetical protein